MSDAEVLDPNEPLTPTEAQEETFETPDVVAGTPESTGDDQDDDEDDDEEEVDQGPGRLHRLRDWYLRNKKKTVPLTIAVLLGLTFGIPASRYGVLGLVLKKTYVVAVTDAKSHLPVSEVQLTYKGKTVKTGADGKATFRDIAVGNGTLTASKKYYQDLSTPMLVPLDPRVDFAVSLTPTGRQVPLKVVNKITGKPVAGAVLAVADTKVTTDQNGEANVVLPPDKDIQAAVLSASGYNQQGVAVKVSQLAIKENTFQLTPAGKLYFLSKRTGKIDVMKSDLDGSNATVVLKATGNESDDDTILLASRDWQYLVLKSRRDSPAAKLYLIETSGDKLTEIDSGDATFTLNGWAGHHLIYQVQRNNVQQWQSKRSALKTYDADKKQLTTIDEAAGEGTSDSDYADSQIQSVNILADRIVYSVIWYAGYYSPSRLDGKKHAIVSVAPDGSNKQTLKDFDAKTVTYMNTVQAEVAELYFRAFVSSGSTFYTYENGKVSADSTMTDEKFNKSYPTFLISPTGESTLWFEQRDGKNTLFVGDANAQNGNEVASLSDYTPYGWYSDNYILVSKNSSELYIMPSNGVGIAGQILKVTDYHKPAANFGGYGYGYGGL